MMAAGLRPRRFLYAKPPDDCCRPARLPRSRGAGDVKERGAIEPAERRDRLIAPFHISLQRISIEWARKTMIFNTEGTERFKSLFSVRSVFSVIKIFQPPAHSYENRCILRGPADRTPFMPVLRNVTPN